MKLGLNKVYSVLEIADSLNDAIVNGEKYLIDIGSKILTDLKKKPWKKNQGFAEKEGFEPPEVWPSTVFKTAAFDHSAISPIALQI